MVIIPSVVEIENICPVDIFDIESEIFGFDNKIKSLHNHSLKRKVLLLQECVLHYRKAKNILKNLIKPENNKYIDTQLYNMMDENLGRVDLAIDELQNVINSLDLKDRKFDVKLKQFEILLIETMESIAIQPLIISSQKYKEPQNYNNPHNKQIKKDIFLFTYYLFQEMYPASQSVGGITRQKIQSFPKNIKLFNPNPSSTFYKKEDKEEKSFIDNIIDNDLIDKEVKGDDLF